MVMTGGRTGRLTPKAVGAALLLVALALLAQALAPEAGRAASKPLPRAGHQWLKTIAIGTPPRVGRVSIPCQPGEPPAFLRQKALAEKRYCPNLPARVAPESSDKSDGRRGSNYELLLSEPVTNEAGDMLDVSAARPGWVWKENPTTWVTNCELVLPLAGTEYSPCGYVTFFDAGWETAEKAPDTNVVEDSIYDSCGTLVDSDVSEGWHVIGTEYTTPGWSSSHHTEVPISVPPECFGVWKMVYVYTQTFSDKETLMDSIEVPFAVMPGPRAVGARWGGGNPAEMSCTEQCVGDPVNSATGEFNEAATDLAIPGRGPGLEMSRAYSSFAARAEVSSPLGPGWAFAYDMSLAVDPETGDATITNGNGSRAKFFATPEGFLASPQVLATLVENEDGTYDYTIKSRIIYTFDESGRLIGISDLNENEVTLAYDEAGRLQTASDEAGRTLTFSYLPSGRLESVADSTGRSVGYGYDEAGRLDEVTDVRGGVERFTYDSSAQMLTRKDKRENVVLTNTYDSSGRVLTQTDALEGKTTFEYIEGEKSNMTKVTDPRGSVTRFIYRNGILAEKIEASGTFDQAEWTYEYDPATLGLAAVTDPNGHTTRASYDSAGNVTATEDALGNRTESSYDSLGNRTAYTDAEGVTTTYEYDERGNLLSSSTPLVGSEPAEFRLVEYDYEDEAHPGDLSTIIDPNGNTTQFAYDEAGNLESVIDAEGNETTYEYDERGNRIAEVSPRGNAEGAEPAEFETSFTYDAAGNRLTTVGPLAHERKWTYDANGNQKTATDPSNHTTTYAYDAANQLTLVERPNGQTEETEYDAGGNVKSQTDGLERATTYKYDWLGHLEAVTDPLLKTTSFVYDGAGKLASRKDPKGRTTTYSYDAGNRLVEVDYSEEATADVEYGYDDVGRRIEMVDGTGESSYEFDSLGRLVSATDGNANTSSYDYDLAGNATAITYPNGKTVTREFDDASRLESVSDWLGKTTSFSYDPDSNLEATTFPEGTANVDEYGYDRDGAMTQVLMKKGSETLASLSYGRDPVGRVASVNSSGLPGAGAASFEYDLADRLAKAGSEAFGYDAANNLTSAPGTTNAYDAANQLEASTAATYGYDSLGQRTKSTPGAAAATYVSSFGSFGSGTGQFNHPTGIAVDSKGNLWVVDTSNRRLQKFDSTGKYLTSFGTFGTGNGQFKRPTDVAIDSSGNLWVTDSGNNRVQKFSEAGAYLSQFGTVGTATGQFKEPEGIDIDSSGNIWVADTYNGRVQAFDNKGKFIRVVGEKGSGLGKISEASDVAIGLEGHVWVADWANRVSEFSSEGAFIRQVGSKGSANGQFLHADAIDVDASGNVWVGDEGNNRVQKFNESGEYLGKFGTSGSGAGQFSFGWPMDVTVGPSGQIWVADTKNNRVQKWQIPEPQPATTYQYDQAGNLTAVERPKAGETPVIAESYVYDGNGLRASQTVSAVSSGLVWDQAEELPLLLSDGQASYIYGPNGLPIEQISSAEVPSFYHHDHLGSTRMLTNASGAATATFSYSAYGAPAGKTGSQTTPLEFAGQYTNAQSGLQYLRARVYDPVTGQFLTRDPITDVTREPYVYAGNDPANFSDPYGLFLGLPSARELATGYVGFWDGATFHLTNGARDLLGIGEGGLELCGPLYEGAEIIGAAASSFFAPLGLARGATVVAKLAGASREKVVEFLAKSEKARSILTNSQRSYDVAKVVVEYLKWVGKYFG
jgi:RHS repeat-associated protein